MEGEGRQRKVLKGMVGDKVHGEAVAFTFPGQRHRGEEVSASALVHLESVEDHLIQLLDENKLLVHSHICTEHTHQYLSSGLLDWYGMRVYQKGSYGSSWVGTRVVLA